MLISHTSVRRLAFAAIIFLGSCSKNNPNPNGDIKISSKDIPAMNAGIGPTGAGETSGTGTSGGGTTTNGGGSTDTNSGGTTSGGGNTGGSADNTGNTGTGSSSGSSSNTGDGGVPIGPTNTIVIKVDNKTYTLKSPSYLLAFGLTTGSATLPGEIGISAFNLGGTDSFVLVADDGKVGVQNISTIVLTIGSVHYQGASFINTGKTKVTQYNYIDITRGSMQGTFDSQVIDGDFKETRMVGSYNISM